LGESDGYRGKGLGHAEHVTPDIGKPVLFDRRHPMSAHVETVDAETPVADSPDSGS
jgi:hypothetical protein